MQIKSLVRCAALSALFVAPLAVADTPRPSDVPNTDTPSTDTPRTTKANNKLSDGDIQLLAHLHDMNQLEITLGQMAQKQAHSRSVKDYAKQLVDDHQANDREIVAFAKKHNVKIPKPTTHTDAEQKEIKDAAGLVARLKTMKGAAFDREYVNAMVDDHDREVADNEAKAEKAQDSDLAQMIRDTKPVLQRHADMARDIQKSIGGESSPTSSTP